MNNILTFNPPFVSKLIFPSVSVKKVLILSNLIIAALLVFYIFQINAEATERHLIRQYEEKISQISRDNQNLQVSLSQSNSLNNIMALMSELNFEKTDKIHYIKVRDNQIVTR